MDQTGMMTLLVLTSLSMLLVLQLLHRSGTTGETNTASEFLDETENLVKAVANFALQNYDSSSGFLSMDCGSERNYTDNALAWTPDWPPNFKQSYVRLAPDADPENLMCDMKSMVLSQMKLDEQLFILNDNRSDFKLQAGLYFGASNGVFHYFSGKEMELYNCSGYDPRTRPWYVGATAIMKDIVILLDTGPSMRNFLLNTDHSLFDCTINITLRLLNTLSTNDRVSVFTSGSASSQPALVTNILGSGSKVIVNWASSVGDGASTLDPLKNRIRSLTNSYLSNQKASLITALVAACDQFNNQSSYLKVVIIITAGEMDGPEDLQPDLIQSLAARNVIVFTYVLLSNEAPNVTTRPLLVNASCSFNGSYEDILYNPQNPLGTVQSFYSYVAKLRFDRSNRLPYWVPKYRSHSGIGDLVTVAYPVFNHSFLVGVAGVDLHVDNLPDISSDANALLASRTTDQSLSGSDPPQILGSLETLLSRESQSATSSCPVTFKPTATGFCNVNNNSNREHILIKRLGLETCVSPSESHGLSRTGKLGVIISGVFLGTLFVAGLLEWCLYFKIKVHRRSNSKVHTVAPDLFTGQLRADIRFTGLQSFQDKFDPQQVLCLCRVADCSKVELVFFHTEGMASLIGVGLPFSTVLIEPSSNIVVTEKSESSWKELWTNSNEASFKPVVFTKSCAQDLSTMGQLSTFKVGSENRNHSGLTNALQNRGVGWMRWLDKVIKERKLEEEKDEANRQRKDHGIHRSAGWHLLAQKWNCFGGSQSNASSGTYNSFTSEKHENSTIDKILGSPPLRNKSIMDIKEDDKGDDNVLIVNIYLDERDCKLYQMKTYHLDTPHGQVRQVCADKEVPRQNSLRECFIKPQLHVEFQYTPSSGGGKPTKRVNVEFIVEYQNKISHEDPPEQWWYHDDLTLSFPCHDSRKAVRMTEHCRIISPTKNSEDEFITNRGQLQSSTTGSSSGIGGKAEVNIGPIQVGGNKDSTKESTCTEALNLIDQQSGKSKVVCLQEAQSFTIIPIHSGNTMTFKASLYEDLESHKMWDYGDCKRAASSGSGGKFSTLPIKVQGSWLLRGDGYLTHEFGAERMFKKSNFGERQPSQEISIGKTTSKSSNRATNSKPGNKESIEDKLCEKFKKEFMFNHGFTHINMEEYKRRETYEWVLLDPEDPSPIPKIMDIHSKLNT